MIPAPNPTGTAEYADRTRAGAYVAGQGGKNAIDFACEIRPSGRHDLCWQQCPANLFDVQKADRSHKGAHGPECGCRSKACSS